MISICSFDYSLDRRSAVRAAVLRRGGRTGRVAPVALFLILVFFLLRYSLLLFTLYVIKMFLIKCTFKKNIRESNTKSE